MLTLGVIFYFFRPGRTDGRTACRDGRTVRKLLDGLAPYRVLFVKVFFELAVMIVEPIMIAGLINNGHIVHFYSLGPNTAPMTKEYNEGSRKIKTVRYRSLDTMRSRYAGLRKMGYAPLP